MNLLNFTLHKTLFCQVCIEVSKTALTLFPRLHCQSLTHALVLWHLDHDNRPLQPCLYSSVLYTVLLISPLHCQKFMHGQITS